MPIPIAPLLVCIIGLLVYALSANQKVANLGLGAFYVGLFWTVGSFAKDLVRL